MSHETPQSLIDKDSILSFPRRSLLVTMGAALAGSSAALKTLLQDEHKESSREVREDERLEWSIRNNVVYLKFRRQSYRAEMPIPSCIAMDHTVCNPREGMSTDMITDLEFMQIKIRVGMHVAVDPVTVRKILGALDQNPRSFHETDVPYSISCVKNGSNLDTGKVMTAKTLVPNPLRVSFVRIPDETAVASIGGQKLSR